MSKINIFIIATVSLMVIGLPAVYTYAPEWTENISTEFGFAPTNREIKMVFVGDIMMDRAVRSSVEKNLEGDYGRLFEGVGFLKDADLAFGNLEGPVSDVGHNVGSIYSFRMAPASLLAVRDAGFDVLSVANNHAGDWSLVAFKDTLKRLSELNILAIGGGESYEQASQVQIKEISGIKIGFLAVSDVGPNWLKATDLQSGILLANDPNLPTLIKKASEGVDVLVVSYHFGEEYKTHSNIRQQFLAHQAIDNGATLVVGHHPHVIQETENYKNGVIAYSLGNFIFDQNFSPETMEGGVWEVVLDGAQIKSTDLKKVKLNNFFQPSI
jgi:gamma-polyglutamate biosynthesis protein CapA